MKKIQTIAALALLTFSAFAQGPGRRPEPPKPSDYPQAHDPVVAFCEGKYYLFTTGFNVGVMSSDDMKIWKPEKPAFEESPKWALDRVPGYRGHTWAPDIIFHDGTWYLYYSCSSFGKNSSAIGVATNKTLNPSNPDYKWVDRGMVVESVPGRDDWNAIDPNVIIDENGTGWMTFGSFWGGIKLVKLDKTLTRVAEPQEWYGLCFRPDGTLPSYDEPDTAIKPDPRGKVFEPGDRAVEAPFLFKKGDWYYLFVSYDLCCRGAKSTYKVVVGRSKTITGPYYDKKGVSLMEGGGSIVVQGNARYAGAGHSATVTFDGKDYLFFHAYDMEDASRSHLIIREINWDADLWPSVKLQ